MYSPETISSSSTTTSPAYILASSTQITTTPASIFSTASTALSFTSSTYVLSTLLSTTDSTSNVTTIDNDAGKLNPMQHSHSNKRVGQRHVIIIERSATRNVLWALVITHMKVQDIAINNLLKCHFILYGMTRKSTL